MPSYRLSGLADDVLLRQGAASARNEFASTAVLLAHIAEIEARHLYADEGYDSMCAFCVGEWGLCEYAAYRRIGAARLARRFPALFESVADGRLSLTAVNLLEPALTEENATELIAAAARLTKRQLRDLLAERSEVGPVSSHGCVEAPDNSCTPLAPALVAPNGASAEGGAEGVELMAVPATPAAPPASPRIPLHAVLSQEAHDDLAYLKALLGHTVPSGEIAEVLGRVFKAAIRELEREKFGVGSRSRTRSGAPGQGANSRHVPTAVRCEVLERDGGRCTFESANGHRCGSRTRLEFDHVTPVAQGGESTVANVRLLCHTHNQLEARRAFGAGFIERKREEARHKAEAKSAAARAKEAERARREAHARELEANAEARARALEVMPWLRALGVPAADARRAAATCEALADAPLEERIRHALRGLAPASARRIVPDASPPA